MQMGTALRAATHSPEIAGTVCVVREEVCVCVVRECVCREGEVCAAEVVGNATILGIPLRF